MVSIGIHDRLAECAVGRREEHWGRLHGCLVRDGLFRRSGRVPHGRTAVQDLNG